MEKELLQRALNLLDGRLVRYRDESFENECIKLAKDIQDYFNQPVLPENTNIPESQEVSEPPKAPKKVSLPVLP